MQGVFTSRKAHTLPARINVYRISRPVRRNVIFLLEILENK